MLEYIISPLAVAFSISTSAGVLVHETRVDKLAGISIVSPAVAINQASALLEGMPHIHIEAASSLSQVTGEQAPGLTPRRDRDEKYHLQKYVSRGVHGFDAYHLPIAT